MTVRARNRQRKRLLFWVLLALFTGGSVLLLGEGLLRTVRWAGHEAMEKGLFRHDPDLLWAMKPGFRGTYSGVPCRVSPLGMRGIPARVIGKKDPGELRILCLGDSRTFGYGVREEESYPARLKAALEERLPGVRVTVFNAGVPGYSSYQGRVWLREKGMALEPDVIVAGFSLNDRRAVEDEGHQDEPEQFRRRYENERWARRMNRFFLYRFTGKLLLRARHTRDDSLSILEWRLRVPPDRFAQNLAAICKAAKELSIPLLLLAMEDHGPHTEPIRQAAGALAGGNPEQTIRILEGISPGRDFFTPMVHYYLEEAAARLERPVETPFRRYLLFDAVEGGPPLRADLVYNEALEEVAAEWGVPVLDVGRLLGARPEHYLDFCHFTPEGNRRIAGAIADRILLPR